jgi:hypothetical protein
MSNDPRLRGAVLLELFDAETGQKVDESGGENYVTPVGLEYARWSVREAYAKSIPIANDFDYTPADPFLNAYLTDSDEAVDTGSSWPEGVLIGYSPKTGSAPGADTQRGILNTVESDATPARAKWVFDWATTAANGSIRSVGFCNNALTDQGISLYGKDSNTSAAVNTLSGSLNPAGLVLLPSGEILSSSASPMKIYDATSLAYLGDIGPTAAQAQAGWVGFSGVTHDGVSMYVTAAGSYGYVRKFPIPVSTGAVTASSVPVSGATKLSSVTYDGSFLWVISDTANLAIRIDKTTGAIDRQFAIPTSAFRHIAFNSERGTLLLTTAEAIHEYDLDGNKVGLHATAFQQNYGSLYLGANRFYVYGYQSFVTRAFFLMAGVGTRILLPSVVTKTNLQTMKLTYTFTYA